MTQTAPLRRLRRLAIFLIFLFFCPLFGKGIPLGAEETPGQQSGVLVFNHQGGQILEDRDWQETVASIMETAFSAVDMRISKIIAAPSSPDSDELLDYCIEAGVRWAISAVTRYEDATLFWQFGVYDSEARIFRAYDFSSTYMLVGISSLEAINSSAGTVARHWRSALTPKTFDGKTAVAGPQRFLSKDEGARVFYGTETGGLIEAGTIENGGLTAEYVLFPSGSPVFGEITMEGFWPVAFSLPAGITEKPKKLPPLQLKTRHSFAFNFVLRGSGGGGLSGVDMEYRFHILPDRLFLQLDWAIWSSSSEWLNEAVFTSLDEGEEEDLHQEYRFAAALYVQPRNGARFRVALGPAVSYMKPSDSCGTFLMEPLWVSLEYHFPRFAIKTEIRRPLPLCRIIEGNDEPIDNPFSGVSFFVGALVKW